MRFGKFPKMKPNCNKLRSPSELCNCCPFYVFSSGLTLQMRMLPSLSPNLLITNNAPSRFSRMELIRVLTKSTGWIIARKAAARDFMHAKCRCDPQVTIAVFRHVRDEITQSVPCVVKLKAHGARVRRGRDEPKPIVGGRHNLPSRDCSSVRIQPAAGPSFTP